MIDNSAPWNSTETTPLLAQNRAYFERAASEALRASSFGQTEEAMLWAKLAAECAWLMHPGFYAHPPIEAMLRELGESLKGTPAVDIPPLPARKGTAKKWLHLITSAYTVGGHTRLVERLIVNASAGNEDQHSIVLIDQGKKPFPSWLRDAAESSGGTLIRLPLELSLADRALVVRHIALKWADMVLVERDIALNWSDMVLLHVHPNDPVASVAFGPAGGPPVVYLNHTDHVFWLGTGCSDVVADIRPEGRDVTAARRGDLPLVILPIPLEAPGPGIPPAESRSSLGIASDEIVLLAIASSYKFAPYGELDFPTMAAKILNKHTNTILLVVGPTASDPHWQNALELVGGRIRLLGIQTEIERYYAAADICLESFPLGSLTSTFDAMLRGVPVLRAPRGVLPIFSMSYYDGLGDTPGSDQEYLLRVSALIADQTLRKETGETQKRAVIDIHTGTGWLDAWRRLVAHIPASHTHRPDVSVFEWNTLSDLDHVWSELQERHSGVKPDKETFFKKRVRSDYRKRSRALILFRLLISVVRGNGQGSKILLRNATTL